MTTPTASTLPFDVGEPSHFGGLALIPLFPENEPRFEYIGLNEAVAHGLHIGEVDEAGSVNDLIVMNPPDVAVLLYEGKVVSKR